MCTAIWGAGRLCWMFISTADRLPVPPPCCSKPRLLHNPRAWCIHNVSDTRTPFLIGISRSERNLISVGWPGTPNNPIRSFDDDDEMFDFRYSRASSFDLDVMTM